MDRPAISVILLSFNHVKYIGQAIESVLSQTFTDFELIIWDDASNDGSWELILVTRTRGSPFSAAPKIPEASA
jgi:glycosyltransferase involved in cell wall biosynthesis